MTHNNRIMNRARRFFPLEQVLCFHTYIAMWMFLSVEDLTCSTSGLHGMGYEFITHVKVWMV